MQESKVLIELRSQFEELRDADAVHSPECVLRGELGKGLTQCIFMRGVQCIQWEKALPEREKNPTMTPFCLFQLNRSEGARQARHGFVRV